MVFFISATLLFTFSVSFLSGSSKQEKFQNPLVMYRCAVAESQGGLASFLFILVFPFLSNKMAEKFPSLSFNHTFLYYSFFFHLHSILSTLSSLFGRPKYSKRRTQHSETHFFLCRIQSAVGVAFRLILLYHSLPVQLAKSNTRIASFFFVLSAERLCFFFLWIYSENDELTASKQKKIKNINMHEIIFLPPR